jgi:hypothetical protein
MDNEKKEIHIVPPDIMVKAAATALGMLALFLLVSTASALLELKYVGAGISPTNTISISGQGEVFAIPDTATFSFTVSETGKDVASAQTKATAKTNDTIDYLKEQGIKEIDIKTTDYSVNPQYEWSNQICTSNGYCPPGRQTIIGYEVSQTILVKIHDTDQAGTLLSGVGSRGVSNVSGLNFTVDDEDALKAEARDKAIKQAKEKAEVLAKSLGVSIVRVVSFNENNYGGPVPMYAKMETMAADAGGMGAAPQIPTGQNKITSDVSVTYEIR